MKIKFVEIQNFRKLKHCKIEFSDTKTVFVGANNSGKTSAMDALILFFKDKGGFTHRDFTLSNFQGINEIARKWIKEKDPNKLDLSITQWQEFIPQLDIWIEVETNEIQHITGIIPTLSWEGGLLGVRLRFEPKNVEELYKEFKAAHSASKEVTAKTSSSLKLWPASMWEFLERKLKSHFTVSSYLLDPSRLAVTPQELAPDAQALQIDAFKGLIKIDVINAQRGFSDPNSEGGSGQGAGNLSNQFREYYEKHLDPAIHPEDTDIAALQAIENAKESFDKKLKESFKKSIQELEELNYPGFGNPAITISSKISAIDGLNHSSAVQFDLMKKTGADDDPLSLPEKYNGLGYQNLISIVFKLIRFRDEWMQVGKSGKQGTADDFKEFEPLHLVLIEEPEAHLHAQIQQVFTRKAYDILRNHPALKDKKEFITQLVISTHSSHIAHEIEFTALRYFKRNIPESGKIPTSSVVNLSEVFGAGTATTKFAIRYLKTTHCDLFFADAAILVEGPAERMLVPFFVKNHSEKLHTSYISILEIGGSHAHTLQPLIEKLGLITLIITDIDSVDGTKKVRPAIGKNFNTGNDTLIDWLPSKKELDVLLKLAANEKESKTYPIRVSYQTPVSCAFAVDPNDTTIIEALPYTFEDSLVLENLQLFRSLNGNKGLMKKMIEASKKISANEACQEMFDALENGKKAEFALELLFIEDPAKLKTPKYIQEGLDWIKNKLDTSGIEIISPITTE